MRQALPDLAELATPIGVDLLYRDLVVGFIPEIYCLGATWYGRLELSLSEADHPIARQLLEFISWSRTWLHTVEKTPSSVPDLDVISRYIELFMTQQWSTRTPEGATHHVIVGAPAFYGDSAVSWQVQDGTQGSGRGRPTRA